MFLIYLHIPAAQRLLRQKPGQRCHVDAAKGIVAHAKENAALSGLKSTPYAI